MLFAFGFALQLMKADSGPGFLLTYVRRLAILFVIGMAHALFYDGDILMDYAMLGLVLIAFRNVPIPVLLSAAVLLLAAFPIGNMIVSLDAADQFAGDQQSMSLAERRIDHPYLGSVLDVITANAHAIPPRIWSGVHNPESSLAFFAMFLIGYATGRSRVLHRPGNHLALLRRICVTGLVVGVASALGEWFLSAQLGYGVFRNNTATIPVQFLGDALFAYGSTMLALGYAAGIVLLVQGNRLALITRWLQNLGRMALTVYLSGTLMFTLLFYGYGFGMLFLLGPTATLGYARLFFAIQVAFCTWWLNRYRFGPAEWVWRALTYGQRPQMRR